MIRVKPGEDMRLTYINAMSTHSQEHCVGIPCMNMTNLHFHGLHVSPDAPQDDVITMMAMPGQSLHYTVNIPTDQPPGLYWYHTHPHGESYQQDLDGMSGAIVIEGIERYVPEVQRMRERILVLRDRLVEENDPAGPELRRTVEIPATGCGTSTEAPEHLFTVNGTLRPQDSHRPGRTSILAHCERFARPVRRSASGWRAARDCCAGWNAAFLSRSKAACRNSHAHPGAARGTSGSNCHRTRGWSQSVATNPLFRYRS